MKQRPLLFLLPEKIFHVYEEKKRNRWKSGNTNTTDLGSYHTLLREINANFSSKFVEHFTTPSLQQANAMLFMFILSLGETGKGIIQPTENPLIGDRISPGGTLHEAWSQVSQVSNTGFLVIFQKGISTRFTSVKVSPYHSILILSLFSMNFHGLKSVWKDVWINCQYWSTRHVQSFCWNSA